MEVGLLKEDCEVTVTSTVDTNMEEITPTESCSAIAPTAIVMEVDTEIAEETVPVTAKEYPFEDKINRDIFIQKVFSIFLLQTIAVGALTALVYISGYPRSPGTKTSNTLYQNWKTIQITMYIVVMFFYILPLCLMVFSDFCDQIRRKPPYNYIILICQPIVITALIMLLASFYGTYWHYQWKAYYVLETFLQALMNLILVELALVVYSAFTMGSQHAFSLRGSMFLAGGIFSITNLRTLILLQPWYMNASVILKSPFSALYITLFLFLCYLYVLYDIYMMTGRDYRQAITPDEYVNGAVNLQIDFIIIIVNLIRSFCKSRAVTNLINAIRNKCRSCDSHQVIIE